MGCPEKNLELQVTLEKISKVVSVRLYHRVAQSLMRCVGDLLLNHLLAEEMPCYNLYGLFRYNGDCLAIYNYAVMAGIPGLEVPYPPSPPCAI
jgi:hypothetical protein